MSGAALAAGYGADLVLGDPRRGHPVAGFGRSAAALERFAYAPSRGRGAVYAVALVGLAAVAAELLARLCARAGLGGGAALTVTVWIALGGRSLAREAERVAAQVERGDLDGARRSLPALVGRDTDGLDGPEVCRATVESVAENTGDAVLGPLLWGAVAGPGGVAAYRAANTLDAMVGNRSERYRDFGWAAARLDDAMSWPAGAVRRRARRRSARPSPAARPPRPGPRSGATAPRTRAPTPAGSRRPSPARSASASAARSPTAAGPSRARRSATAVRPDPRTWPARCGSRSRWAPCEPRSASRCARSGVHRIGVLGPQGDQSRKRRRGRLGR